MGAEEERGQTLKTSRMAFHSDIDQGPYHDLVLPGLYTFLRLYEAHKSAAATEQSAAAARGVIVLSAPCCSISVSIRGKSGRSIKNLQQTRHRLRPMASTAAAAEDWRRRR